MARKQVPAPSPGRIVLYAEPNGKEVLHVWPAVVIIFDADYVVFGRCTLRVLDDDDQYTNIVRGVCYGENKPGCWWWPPRVEGTIEVEE